MPLTGTPNGDAPPILNASYNFKAEVDIPPGGAEGMLITQGGRFGGYGFYLVKGKPVFTCNLVDLKRLRWEGPDALSAGKHTLEFDFKYDGLGMGTLAFNNLSGIGRSGTGVLKVDYRHMIWSLVRKPGAFMAYKYRKEIFPSLVFKVTTSACHARHGSLPLARRQFPRAPWSDPAQQSLARHCVFARSDACGARP
jgi:hypothetical protein